MDLKAYSILFDCEICMRSYEHILEYVYNENRNSIAADFYVYI